MAILLTLKKRKKINQNTLARMVVKLEGKKKSISIAQVKEVQRILLGVLGEMYKTNPRGVLELVRGK